MARLNLDTFDKGTLVTEIKDGNATIRFYDGSYRGISQADYARICDNVGKTCCRLAIEGKIKDVRAFGVKATFVHKSDI